MMNDFKMSTESKSVHADHPRKDPYGSHGMPIYQTSTFSFDSVEDGKKFFAGEEDGSSHAYSRLGNPTVERFEDAIAAEAGYGVENSSALAFGSGMAAITTALMATAHGGAVIAQPALYGCTGQFLREEAPQMNIDTYFVDLGDLEALEKKLSNNPEVKVVFGESMANPTMKVCNIPAVAELAHKYDALFMIDNTFGTPFHVRPLSLGADAVLHSTTKYINGHGSSIGGALVASDEFTETYNLATFRKNFGGVLSPFDGWLNLNGIKTFNLRMQRHAENTQQVAEYLQNHNAVEKVYYPGLESHEDHQLANELFEGGFGGVLSFELKGGFEAGVSLMENVQLCTLAVSLGTVDTLIQHPASMTHSVIAEEAREEAGISNGLVRLAVGIEQSDDILADLKQALKNVE